MPPEDVLFPDKAPAGGPPKGAPQGGNGADPVGGDTPLTLAAAAELITQALSPMAERLQELGTTNAQLAAQIQNIGAPKGNQPDLTKEQEDFLTRFSQDPEGASRGLVREELQQAAPLIGALLNSTTQMAVEKEKTAIDREFGDGAWDKFFDKPLSVVLDSYRKSNIAALADKATITRETDGLKGRQFDNLVQYREESRKKAAEAKESGKKELMGGILEQVQQTNLTGGLRRISGGEEEITEDLKGYLAERAAAIGSGPIDPKQWLRETDYGNTYEDFLEHQKRLQAERGEKS